MFEKKEVREYKCMKISIKKLGREGELNGSVKIDFGKGPSIFHSTQVGIIYTKYYSRSINYQ